MLKILRKRIEKERQSGFIAILFTIIFASVFSLMFTPFVGIPVAILSGMFIHFTDRDDE
ncbi:VraH family protein [Staphylococcus kloosii]|uniref:VraH family protein n=1 Tax=Staphylococcus kloosii TaxID=29384 RepID=UPI0028A420A4|nr:VraH family protein [Staphylococcus kloosii]MDT3960096.1 VraH family protein [Staphylococcus kloosii]